MTQLKYKPYPIEHLFNINDIVHNIINYCITTKDLPFIYTYGYEYISPIIITICNNDYNLYYKVIDNFCNSEKAKLINKDIIANLKLINKKLIKNYTVNSKYILKEKYKPHLIEKLFNISDTVYSIIYYCITTDKLRWGYEYIPDIILTLCNNNKKLYFKVMDNFCNSKKAKLLKKDFVASYFISHHWYSDDIYDYFFKKKYALSKTLYYIMKSDELYDTGEKIEIKYAKKFIKLHKKVKGNVSYNYNNYIKNCRLKPKLKLKLYIHNFNLNINIIYYDLQLNKLIAIYY